QMPEWYLMIATLATIAVFSAVWRPFQLAVPLLAVAIVPPLAQAWLSAMRASFPDLPAARWPTRVRRRLLTALLHLAQPLARLRGRLNEGLTPWRRRGTPAPAPLLPVTTSLWPVRGPVLTLAFALLTRSAWHDHAWVAAGVLGTGALFFFWRTLEQCTAAMATIRDAIARLRGASAQ